MSRCSSTPLDDAGDAHAGRQVDPNLDGASGPGVDAAGDGGDRAGDLLPEPAAERDRWKGPGPLFAVQGGRGVAAVEDRSQDSVADLPRLQPVEADRDVVGRFVVLAGDADAEPLPAELSGGVLVEAGQLVEGDRGDWLDGEGSVTRSGRVVSPLRRCALSATAPSSAARSKEPPGIGGRGPKLRASKAWRG